MRKRMLSRLKEAPSDICPSPVAMIKVPYLLSLLEGMLNIQPSPTVSFRFTI